MKDKLILIILSFVTLLSYSQKLQLENTAPFTAVKWKNDTPIVKIEENWYQLKSFDNKKVEEVISFCKEKYKERWKKRFTEDIVEVLYGMGLDLKSSIKLLLSNNFTTIQINANFTIENRKKIIEYKNKDKKKPERINVLTVIQAIEDIEKFQILLQERSSYVHLTDYKYEHALNILKKKIKRQKNNIEVDYLTHELAKILAEIGDRHSYVINKGSEIKTTLQLPFYMIPYDQQILALQKTNGSKSYEYLYKNYPYIKSINNKPLNVIMDSLVYQSKKAPRAAKFSLGAARVQQLGKLYFKNNKNIPSKLKVTFANEKVDTTVFIGLKHKDHRYYSNIKKQIKLKANDIQKGEFGNISKFLKQNIGYICIPKMFSLKDTKGLKKCIDSSFLKLKDTKALIIDLRYNSGGKRDLIKLIGEYIVPKSESPWVANVAYLRINKRKSEYSTMSSRYLHPYESFNSREKKSIKMFNKTFLLEKEFDKTKFSKPHYMVLNSGDKNYTQQVYILVNEHSFSAASVFTSAFKGLPNIKIVGITTDGSSGNSKKEFLKHSNILVKLSTMLSFQRNGKTLDGNGTMPDIEIQKNESQILHGVDFQLNTLTNRINN